MSSNQTPEQLAAMLLRELEAIADGEPCTLNEAEASVFATALTRLVAERDEARREVDNVLGFIDEAEALARAVRLLENLFAMIPREVWRDSGGDDGQGHYEGDYRAEGIRDEIASLRARAAGAPSAPDGEEETPRVKMLGPCSEPGHPRSCDEETREKPCWCRADPGAAAVTDRSEP